jgi:electron transfer flavoprotein alpha subunit
VLRVAVLAKQVPVLENMWLGDDRRLRRTGVELELNAYCRRAIARGVALAREHSGSCTVFTLGPPPASDVLREAIAWGADQGVLVTDPAFAGSDTLATARALSTALSRREFDLVLVGRNSVDADTGQVGPEVAAFLGWPFLAAARELEIDSSGTVRARLELDDGWAEAEVALPTVVSCAERLCQPAKVEPERRATVEAERIEVLTAADLGAGPWGQAGSPTRVGEVRAVPLGRRGQVLSGPVARSVATAVQVLAELGALRQGGHDEAAPTIPGPLPSGGQPVAVLLEHGREREARELLGRAAELAAGRARHVAVLDPAGRPPDVLASWGADRVVQLPGADAAQDAASSIASWCRGARPWAMLASATLWGREALSRLAVHLNAGLTGDVIDFSVTADRLLSWKPTIGDRQVAAIWSDSGVQLATVRPGALPVPAPRPVTASLPVEVLPGARVCRIRLVSVTQDDHLDALTAAGVVIAVGMGVDREDYDWIEQWRVALGAELGATRKVTDAGWLPHSRQIGLTGRNVAPQLYLALGVRGKLNHAIGFQRARAVLAVNSDPRAPVFQHADVGIVGDWRAVAQELFPALAASRGLLPT